MAIKNRKIFLQKTGKKISATGYSDGSVLLTLLSFQIITILLGMGGIELNPGPTQDKVTSIPTELLKNAFDLYKKSNSQFNFILPHSIFGNVANHFGLEQTKSVRKKLKDRYIAEYLRQLNSISTDELVNTFSLFPTATADFDVTHSNSIFGNVLCCERNRDTPGDKVLVNAEAVRNMPGIKWNAKEVQVLRININPEKPHRILPVPPAPRISEKPLHSNSERPSHINYRRFQVIHGESRTEPGQHSQEQDIEEIKYSPENPNIPRKLKLDAEKRSADTRATQREVKYNRVRSLREQSSSKDLSMRPNLPSVPLPDIKIMPDEVHNASPAPEESSASLSPSVLNKTIPFNITVINQEPALEIISTELEGDSPATNCLLNDPNSIWIDASPSQLLFGETGISSDEIVDLTSIDNNDM